MTTFPLMWDVVFIMSSLVIFPISSMKTLSTSLSQSNASFCWDRKGTCWEKVLEKVGRLVDGWRGEGAFL